MDDKSKEFNNFFTETYAIYKKVTTYAILLEKIGGGKVEVASINELRGVLYHLYSFLDDTETTRPEHCTENYIEAKEHLFRAYYDIFSMLCTLFTERIYSYSQDFGLEVIAEIYPKYFSEIIPELTVIIEQISHVRSIRQSGKIPSGSFDANHEIIVVLLKWYKDLQSLTNIFVSKRKEENKKKKIKLFLQIAIPILCVLLGLVLSHFFS